MKLKGLHALSAPGRTGSSYLGEREKEEEKKLNVEPLGHFAGRPAEINVLLEPAQDDLHCGNLNVREPVLVHGSFFNQFGGNSKLQFLQLIGELIAVH